MISLVPIKIFSQIEEGKQYDNFVYAEGEVIEQHWSPKTAYNSSYEGTCYDITAKIQYEANGNEYIVTQVIRDSNISVILGVQDMIYNQDNPSEAHIASYDVIAGRYIPEGNDSWADYILYFAIMILMGIICIGVGVILVFIL